jgi:hypothetical protein
MTVSATVPSTTTLGSGSCALGISLATASDGSATLSMFVGGKQVGYFQSLTATQTSDLKKAMSVVSSLTMQQQNLVVSLFGDVAYLSQFMNVTNELGWLSGADKLLVQDMFSLFNEGTTAQAVTVLGTGTSVLNLYVGELAGKSDAQFTVSVDGKQVGGVQTVHANQAAGQEQLFQIEGSFGSGQHTVTLDLLNGSSGSSSSTPSLFLDSAVLNGVAVPGGTLSMAASGNQSFTVGTKVVGNPASVAASLAVSENASATAIGITAPTDPNYASQTLSITISSLPTDGTVTLADGKTAVTAGEVLSVSQLVGLEFTAAAGAFDRTSALAYTVSDPAGNTASGSASLSIGKAVGNPVVVAASLQVAEGAGVAAIGITAPTDPNYAASALSVTLGSLPTDGTLTLPGVSGTVSAGQVLTVAQLASLQFTATPGAFDKSSALSYTVTDPDGNATMGSATLSIGKAVGNPTTVSTSLAVAVGASATSIGLVAPTDPNYSSSALGISVGALPTDGTITLADGVTPVTAGESLTVSQLVGLDFTPSSGMSSQSSAFTYTVSDPDGNSATGSATLAINAPVVTTYNEGAAGGTVSTNTGDTVNIGTGNVTINATGASVNVNGGAGQMTFFGGNGNDTIDAGSGYSSITAGSGGLNFTAGTGNATITASASGSESFNIVDGHAGGTIAIFGFVAGQDAIHAQGFPGVAVTSQGAVPSAYDIGFSDGTTVILPNFVPDGVHSPVV